MNKQKSDWNDINVAYHVAQYGTLTAAAEALGVHHSTVLRRVNILEERLNTRLFHRHARGYIATDAGLLLMQVAENTQNDFDKLVGQLQGVDTQLTGTLSLTSVSTLMTGLVPILAEFQRDYPQIKLECAAEGRIYKLEHGEAHVSIRPGKQPTNPDYVVQHLARQGATLYGTEAYIREYGLIDSLKNISKHRFISTINSYQQVKAMAWLEENVSADQIYYKCTDFMGYIPAIKAGFGIAPLNCWLASLEPDLVPMMAPVAEWESDLWLVTHRDMHHTSKVQALTQHLKKAFLDIQPQLL